MRWHALGATIALFWAAPLLAQTPGTPPPVAPPPAAAPPAAPAPVAPAPAAPPTPPPEAPDSALPPEAPPAEPPVAETLPPVVLPAAPSSEPVPSPADMEKLLDEQLPPPVTGSEWSAPTPVVTLHGYLRVRGELMDTFWLGRRELSAFQLDPEVDAEQKVGQGPDPFSRFRPIERRSATGSVTGGDPDAERALQCADEGRTGSACDVDTLQFASMRFRLAPELALSEDVRIKAQIDVFDNMVLGSAPTSYYGVGAAEDGGASTVGVFAGSDVPPEGNALGGDSIRAKAAWAEVRNRDLGELRFGRMPQQWGLGMLYDAGSGLDDDQGTYLDRVLGITKIEALGLYLSASYDFAAEGVVDPGRGDGRPLEQSQLDDLDQFTLSAARRRTDEERAASKEKGELTLEGGIQLQIRNQDSRYLPRESPMAGLILESSLRNITATTYTTDVWGRLAYRGLRIEAELAWVSGTMDDVVDPRRDYDVEQLGYVIETELRLLDERLGLYLDHGLATGDSDVEGLSSNSNFVQQLGPDHDGTVSTFRFHPSYRVDLILWRNIMTQVTGALYVRPGVSYDFMRDGFGQMFGARLDFIWSRATSFVQTWGNDPDLGVEANLSLYYRTEDGPDLTDGFHTTLQYGVLFPLRGLDYRHREVGLDTAQTLRLLLGVVY
jgi:uncharacterized protein (TIGR04551 family)